MSLVTRMHTTPTLLSVLLSTCLTLTVLSAPLARAASAEPQLEAGKLFKGPEGLRVEVYPVKAAADAKEKEALVRVTGSGTEFDGKVLPHKYKEWDDKRSDYATTRRGRGWATLTSRPNWGYGKFYQVHLPGKRDGIDVAYDEAGTKELKPADVLAALKKQRSDGSLDAFMKFDRKKEEGETVAELEKTVQDTNKACGTKVTAKIDWATVTDEDVKSLSIASFCGGALEAMESLCSSKVAKDAITAKVAAVECRFGDKLGAELKDKTLRWTTSKDAANQEAFAKSYLEKNL